jgi:hypothetical protein
MDLVLIIGGVLVVVAMMIFVINPPDAWIKKVFSKQDSKSDRK